MSTKGIMHGFIVPMAIVVGAVALKMSPAVAMLCGVFYLGTLGVLYASVFSEKPASSDFYIASTPTILFFAMLGSVA